MMFSFWNLLVVLCFVILYLGIALVFVQLRKLRDDLHHHSVAKAATAADSEDKSRACAEVVLRRLTSFETHMSHSMEEMPKQLKNELSAIQNELRYLAQSAPIGMGGTSRMEGGGLRTAGGGSGSESDAYREARLLLSNGVDEERVVKETGLTVEEVSLLKRMSPAGPDEMS